MCTNIITGGSGGGWLFERFELGGHLTFKLLHPFFMALKTWAELYAASTNTTKHHISSDFNTDICIKT